MSELEDKLNGLLSSPEKMAQIMQLAQSFSAAGTGTAQSSADSRNNISAGDIDPRLMQMLTRLLKDMSSPDKNTELISAVQPYLRSDRREKVEKALKLAKLMKLAGKAFSEIGGSGLV